MHYNAPIKKCPAIKKPINQYYFFSLYGVYINMSVHYMSVHYMSVHYMSVHYMSVHYMLCVAIKGLDILRLAIKGLDILR
jgi:hypothetical protein